jgi:superfamily II DNA/RNA helicase
MVVFVSTNDSVQFHEEILRTFSNRKFNMYLDDGLSDDDDDNDLDKKAKKSTKSFNSKSNLCDFFALYGNMDQHRRAEILARFCKTKSGVLICTVCIFLYHNFLDFLF